MDTIKPTDPAMPDDAGSRVLSDLEMLDSEYDLGIPGGYQALVVDVVDAVRSHLALTRADLSTV